MRAQRPNTALAVISIAVLFASSVWFTGTAVTPALSRGLGLGTGAVALLTTSVQLGFISGTFLFAVFNLADLFNPRRVFGLSALAGALLNGAFAAFGDHLLVGLGCRFACGVALAGVYPVAMKITATWFERGLGWRLGILVGALTVGTASPYLVLALGAGLPWQALVLMASGFASVGALLVLFGLSDGPWHRKRSAFDWRMLLKVFLHSPFRLTALGYFGHMWELYAFWALVAIWLRAAWADSSREWLGAVPLVTFAVIGCGGLGCVAGGYLSKHIGERRVASLALAVSGCLCLGSGFAFQLPPVWLFSYALVWGLAVVADSPQFSALAARHAPDGYVGTALTIQNGIGFALTIASIELIPVIADLVEWRFAFSFLALGPLAGLVAMHQLGKVSPEA